jgi:nucleotide-binding universal stress UspA family protein
MYKTIVVPLDGSARALSAIPPARRLARLHHARLRLVTVAAPGLPATEPDAILAAGRETAGEDSVDVCVLKAADAAAALARLDRDEPESLLCLSTSARRPLGRALFGSVAREIVSHAEDAIVLVGPACDAMASHDIERMFVCLDGSEAGEIILPWATRWSETTGLSLVLVRVVYPLVDPQARVPPTDADLDALGYVRSVALRLERAGNRVIDVTVQHPSPSDAIVGLATSGAGALVAVSTANRGPAGETLEGSTAASIVRQSPVPVIVARQRASASSG